MYIIVIKYLLVYLILDYTSYYFNIININYKYIYNYK